MASKHPLPPPGTRILIVEDDNLQGEVLAAGLSSYGYEVERASNGLDAIRMVRDLGCDLMLIDYQIPKIDGLATARMVRDFMGDMARPAMIALTSSADSLASREAGSRSAFDGIVEKPIRLSDLPLVIESHLNSAPNRATRRAAGVDLLLGNWADYGAETVRPNGENGEPMPPRILVVEDDDLQQSVLQEALASRGYDVQTASNGVQAVRMVLAEVFDLVLIDYQIPEMDGLAAATLILDCLCDAVRPRMVAVTSAPERLRRTVVEAGSAFDGIVAKSEGLPALFEIVARLLAPAPNPGTRQAAPIGGSLSDGSR